MELKAEIAHFFWYGQLSKFEIKCIESFVKQGFDVNLWSYQTFDNLPIGATLRDARDILPEDHLTKYHQRHAFNKEGETNKIYASLAAFSDAFRYVLLSKLDGWYFDCDCFCLKSQQEFKQLRQNRKVIAGYDSVHADGIGSAIFCFPDKKFASALVDELNERCVTNNYVFDVWAYIGPAIITDVVNSSDLKNQILPRETFYPIHWKEMDLFLNPHFYNQAAYQTKDSYVVHIWNSQLSENLNIKSDPFPSGSFLHRLFNEERIDNIYESTAPLVSVIIPVYTPSKWLFESINSALNQTYPNYEIIVVNDGSPEDVKSIMDQYKNNNKIYYYEHPVNRGLAAARNTGISHSRGEYIFPLDADDTINPNFLSKSVARINSKTIVTSKNMFNDKHLNPTGGFWPKEGDLAWSNIVHRNVIINSSMYPKTLWDEIQRYDENLFAYEDWEFWIRAYKAGYRLVRLDNEQINYRVHGNNLTDKAAKSRNLLLEYIFEKHPDRKNAIKSLYVSILNRSADESGLCRYLYDTDLSIDVIRNVLYQSDEYKKCQAYSSK
jgi:glycosyltransferase involved in cell wall biosynthesis